MRFCCPSAAESGALRPIISPFSSYRRQLNGGMANKIARTISLSSDPCQTNKTDRAGCVLHALPIASIATVTDALSSAPFQ
jgi:hypothetical protein